MQDILEGETQFLLNQYLNQLPEPIMCNSKAIVIGCCFNIDSGRR